MCNFFCMFPPLWSVIPFVVFLVMIASGPVLYPRFWHRYYPYIAGLLALCVVSYYLLVLGDYDRPLESLIDYVQFLVLLGTLYVVSSNVVIDIGGVASWRVNLVILWSGAVLANFIGTTGASVLLIRPYIRANRGCIAPFHIVFFIFMVSNVGGALTPIGDPPLFLGFLKGVPFFWTLRCAFLPWLFVLMCLSVVFYYLSSRRGGEKLGDRGEEVGLAGVGKWVLGRVTVFQPGYLLLFVVVVGSLFLDHNKFSWIPTVVCGGHRVSFLKEVILLLVGFYAYKRGNREVLRVNGFSLEPLKEVVFVFLGIFGTMIPALELVERVASSEVGQGFVTPHYFYWLTGGLSSLLDNAPTYYNFLVAGMASKGFHVYCPADVCNYVTICPALLRATSLAAVFFGAMTYIGNGPNFMVRSIAESEGVRMPSFGGYLLRYGLLFLLPVLFLVWLVFFVLVPV